MKLPPRLSGAALAPVATLALVAALTLVAAPAAGTEPSPPIETSTKVTDVVTLDVVALVEEVGGAPELRRRGAADSVPLRRFHDLLEGDRIEGRGGAVAVCPDGKTRRLTAPSTVAATLCAENAGAARTGSPDRGRWLRYESVVVFQHGTRNGEVEEDDLGAVPVLLSPRCPRRPGKPAPCSRWDDVPNEIYWLGLAQADTYLLHWSGAEKSLRVAADVACTNDFLSNLVSEAPACRTPWPAAWRLRDEPGTLTLSALRGRFQTLPGRDVAVIRAVASHEEGQTLQPFSRVLHLYRADLVQPALAAILGLSIHYPGPWPAPFRQVRAELWQSSGLLPLASRDLDSLDPSTVSDSSKERQKERQ